MIVHKNVLNSFLVNNCRLGRVDTSPPSLIFNNNNMALQVWLPLNKSGADKNQGLANINITSTATYNASGKLGGSYDFSNSSNRISFPSQPWMAPNDTNSISIAMWVKAGSFNYIIACNAFEYKLSSSSFMWRLGNGGTNTFATVTSGITFTTGTWYHLCGTWNAENKKLAVYVNGELIKENTSTLTSYNNISSTINLVHSGTWNINDFRFYDHCLSPKEVKEISKGLVLHYPLNDAYVEETNNLFSANLTHHRNWNNSGSAIWNWDDNTIPKINNSIIYSISRTDTGNSAIGCGACNLVAGKTYTASVYVYLSGNVDSNLFYIRSVDTHIATLKYSNDTNPQKWPQNQWIRATATFTPSAAYNSCYICSYLNNANSKRALTCWQIEEKDHPTPYTPNTRNETTVYDCSGYQNNGTISGSLSCSSDSPRYNKSCKFGSGIIGTTSGFASAQSYAFWANVIDKTAQIVFVDGASKLGFGISSGYFLCNTEGGTSTVYSISNLTIGWHHFAVVNNLLYIDGVLQENRSDINNYWLYSGSMLEIGNRSNGHSYPWKGQISDFRVYATALSPEDIKELYNTSCIINS